MWCGSGQGGCVFGVCVCKCVVYVYGEEEGYCDYGGGCAGCVWYVVCEYVCCVYGLGGCVVG